MDMLRNHRAATMVIVTVISMASTIMVISMASTITVDELIMKNPHSLYPEALQPKVGVSRIATSK
jgi:hypothetical protein